MKNPTSESSQASPTSIRGNVASSKALPTYTDQPIQAPENLQPYQQYASNYHRANVLWPAPPAVLQYPGLLVPNAPPLPMYPNQYARYQQMSPAGESQQLYPTQQAQYQQPIMPQSGAYGASR